MDTREQHPPQETLHDELLATLFSTFSNPVHQAETSGGSTTASSVASYEDSPDPGQDQPEAVIECDHCSAKFSPLIKAVRHRLERDLNDDRFLSAGSSCHSLKKRVICSMRSVHAQRDLRPHRSYTPYTCRNSPADLNLPKRRYTPYTRQNSPADLNLPRRSHRQTAGVSVATQEGTLAEARPSFSAEDMSGSLSSVVKSSQDSSTGRSFGNMRDITATLFELVKSLQDSSRDSSLGDVSEIRAGLSVFPVALRQQRSPMELNEAAGGRKDGLPEVFHSPFRGPRSSPDLSRGSSLGDMSEIRAALPAIPAALPLTSGMFPHGAERSCWREEMGLPEVFHSPFRGPRSSPDLSRGGSLDDMSGIRVALPVIPATLRNDTQTVMKLSQF